MKVNMLDLQRSWPILGYLPHSLLKNVRLVYVFGSRRNDVLVVTNDHKVFFYGSYQNMPVSLLLDVPDVTELKELSQKRVEGFACNSHHCMNRAELFVVSYLMSGEVHLWGFNPSDQINLETPLLIGELQKTVVQVACGRKHFLVLTSDGMVYAWGDNGCGQTASELSEPTISEPRKISILGDNDVAEIACGSYFSVVVTRKREVFGWGKNSDGQLGENKENEYMPVVRELSAFKNVRIQKIACGGRHILGLDTFGTVVSCGANDWGQLGTDSAGRTPFRFAEIAASKNSSVGKTSDGDIMVWGLICDWHIETPQKTPCRSLNEAFALYCLGGMPKPLEVAPESENVAETVRKSFENPEMSDFKVIVQNKEIPVHKYLLAHRSKYFERMFANNWSEGKMSCIKMDESYEGMSAFLKYLYTDEINNVDLKLLLDVAIIAEKYGELNLVNLCLKQFESGLNQSNVAELYEQTLDPRLSNFNDLCMNYASRCVSAVTASRGFNSWNPETYKSFFQHEKIKSVLATCD